MVKPPLSVRNDPQRLEQFFVLREGVPEGLLPSLVEWAVGQYTRRWDGRRVGDRESIARLERVLEQALSHDANSLISAFHGDHELLLDAIDNALTAGVDRRKAVELEIFLREARSVYAVGLDGSGDYELQHRQPPELTEVVQAATSGAGAAAHHLRQAWSNAFGREPDATAACDESVRAIEAAAKPVITPSDQRATLGKMIKAMSDAPHKWTTDSNASGDIGAVVAMMDLVWTGFKRHGDPTQSAAPSVETAQMLVQSAALLVHWFQAGHTRRAA